MSYHVVIPRFGFKELPDRVLVREDGAYGDHKAHGTPLINYWYVLEQCISPTEREIISAHLEQLEVDNAKLRKLARMMWLACKSKGIVGGIYAYPDKNSNADEWIRFEPLLRELGVEVDAYDRDR